MGEPQATIQELVDIMKTLGRNLMLKARHKDDTLQLCVYLAPDSDEEPLSISADPSHIKALMELAPKNVNGQSARISHKCFTTEPLTLSRRLWI